ncbi:proline-rich protein HaeIII subfamily 1 [Lutzomyia longipalpis]|uniref:proline-rich protein HaeIII subfamily 1 n=1 Tax=Lutzomyia longipalpis TaxID=7200 RepID=UPI0024840F10|nr:proline-rich protein HaeIII subfamily 1 [Lutzomyia longipalpis]
MKYLFILVVLGTTSAIAWARAQFDGPVPPRINVPGAIPLPISRPSHTPFRNDRVLGGGNGGPAVIRVRRPLGPQGRPLGPGPIHTTQRSLEDAKPVTEEPEDEQPFIPHIISTPPQPQPQQHFSFFEPNGIADDIPQLVARFQPQERPAPVQPQRFLQPEPPRPQPPKPTPVRPRPAFKEARPQFDDEPLIRRNPEPRPSPRPHHQSHVDDGHRERKPVAQILRKYREEHEDGTITWGFENDDGSFKEETIGIDCITRGRYGYIDPDGEKREYTYETGIQCDPNKRDEESDEDDLGGYVDYQENKAVLPSGVRVDLGPKNKSKRPGSGGTPANFYRN